MAEGGRVVVDDYNWYTTLKGATYLLFPGSPPMSISFFTYPRARIDVYWVGTCRAAIDQFRAERNIR